MCMLRSPRQAEPPDGLHNDDGVQQRRSRPPLPEVQRHRRGAYESQGRTVQLLFHVCCRCIARIASGDLLVVKHIAQCLLTLALLQERRL